MNVRWIPLRFYAIHFFFVYLFSFAIGVSHFAAYQEFADAPLSTKTAHHTTFAIQTEDSFTDFDKDDNFAKLHANWSFLQFSITDWHSSLNSSPFFKSIENSSLLPRAPPSLKI
jgi:hypothetical protein